MKHFSFEEQFLHLSSNYEIRNYSFQVNVADPESEQTIDPEPVTSREMEMELSGEESESVPDALCDGNKDPKPGTSREGIERESSDEELEKQPDQT